MSDASSPEGARGSGELGKISPKIPRSAGNEGTRAARRRHWLTGPRLGVRVYESTVRHLYFKEIGESVIFLTNYVVV